MDAEIGEVGERPLQRDELTRAGDAEAVALAHHDAKRQGRGGDDRADEIERRRQPVALDLTDDFQPIGAAGFGFLGVGDRLDDDFESEREAEYVRDCRMVTAPARQHFSMRSGPPAAREDNGLTAGRC